MSGYVLAASRFELISAAERERIFVAGVSGGAMPSAAAAPPGTSVEPLVFGGVDPAASQGADMQRGMRIMSTLAHFGTGSALVIRKGRVFSIGASERPIEVIERAAAFIRDSHRRSGVAVLGPRESLDEPLIEAAAACGLSGIVVMFGHEDRPQHRGAVAAKADALGLFIAGAAIAEAEAS